MSLLTAMLPYHRCWPLKSLTDNFLSNLIKFLCIYDQIPIDIIVRSTTIFSFQNLSQNGIIHFVHLKYWTVYGFWHINKYENSYHSEFKNESVHLLWTMNGSSDWIISLSILIILFIINDACDPIESFG